jgi:hypothetical protein
MQKTRRIVVMAALAGVTFNGFPLVAEAATTVDLIPIGSYNGGGATAAGRSEIVAFDPVSKKAFTTNDAGSLTQIDIIDLTNPAAPVAAGTFDLSPYGASVQSVATRNGIVAAAVAPIDPVAAKGSVVFFSTAGVFLANVQAGYLPDAITFTPDGAKLLSADEGQPGCSGATVIDVPGSVTVIDAATFTASTASFNASHVVPGVRVNLPTPDADELEPEYIAVSSDSTTAYVTLQENNAIATVNIATATVSSVGPMPTKDHSLAGRGLDPSDQDSATNTAVIGIATRPIAGMPMPDGIARLERGGSTYLLTANEGDGREYGTCFSRDDVRLSTLTLDSTTYPTGTVLKGNGPNGAGRLRVSRTDGNTDADPATEQIYSFGTRSMGIYLPNGTQVGDTGDSLEQYIATNYPAAFNSDSEGGAFDSRSPNKGPEPESVVVANLGGTDVAFVGLERIGGVAVYDLTSLANPLLVEYSNPKLEAGVQPGDNDGAPEGMAFVSATDSPSGIPLLLVSNEVSGTTTIYEVRFTSSPPAVVPEAPLVALLSLSALGLFGLGMARNRRTTQLAV